MTSKIIARRNGKAFFCPTTAHHIKSPRPWVLDFDAVYEGEQLPDNTVCAWCRRSLPLNPDEPTNK